MSFKAVCACAPLYLVSVILAQPQPATFSHPKQYPAGVAPVTAAMGDFNGDGKPDLAVADETGGNLNILLSNGSGFDAPVSYPIVEAKSVAVADFNGDGILDLAVAGSVSVYVLIGNGDGTFQPPVSLGVEGQYVAVGDFNGDGNMDLAIADKSILVLLGNGHGSFGSPIASNAGYPVLTLTVGDFNNDGKPDLAAGISVLGDGAYPNYWVATLLGNGDGSFQSSQMPEGLGTPCCALPAIFAYDVNRDGNLDLLEAGGQNGVEVALGNGDGTFQPAAYYYGEAEAVSMCLADVNGDGLLDLITANSGNSVSVLLGNGKGSFQLSTSYAANDAPVWIGIANFVGSGPGDLAVLNHNGYVTLIPRAPGGAFQSQRSLDFTEGLAGAPVLADFNGDGKLDAAVIGYPAIEIALGEGNGNFHAGSPVIAGPDPLAMVTADFNGDGKADLAVTDMVTNLVYILPGKGDGTFSAGPSYAVPANSISIAAADLNSDGITDLVVQGYATGSPSNHYITQVFLGTGGGTFGNPLTVTSTAAISGLVVGDFNGDGIPDLVLGGNYRGAGNPIYPALWLGNGNGTFQGPITFYTGSESWPILAADFNGDGKLDMAVITDEGDLVVLLGNGNGTFRTGQTIVVSGSAVAADVNGDGRLDLVFGTTHTFVFYLGNGDGTFVQQAGQTPRVGFDGIPAAGDLNNDGKPDLVSSQTLSQTGTGWVNQVSAIINTTAPVH